MKNKLIIFLKGFLMGICDIIPGISGGTVAFITGIYERLIKAVKAFSPELIISIIKLIIKRDKETIKKAKENIKQLDLLFLITLFTGIASAMIIMSKIVSVLLEKYLAFTLSFFIGLIIASSKIIFDSIKNHKIKNISFGIIGLIIGILLSIITPKEINPGLIYVFIGGFLAISAMFLPGISGAFILLVLGIYDFMLGVIHNIKEKFSYFLVFVLGAGLGAFSISRIISYLFKKDKCKTLYMLLGLVIGCLSIPIKKVYQSQTSWDIISITFSILSFIIGIMLVSIVRKIESGKNAHKTGN